MLQVSSPISPPYCYGSGYDNDSPRCAACSFHRSCRQEVIKTGVMMYYQQYSPPAPQQPQYYVPAPTAQFIPAAPPPPPQPVQFRPQPWTPPVAQPMQFRVPVQQAPIAQPTAIPLSPGTMPGWAPAHFQIPATLAPSNIGYYGYYPDTMWAALASVTPVWRPQQPGESFGVRVAKNVVLTLIEHTFQQLMLATRQAFLPSYAPVAKEPIIDVTPKQ